MLMVYYGLLASALGIVLSAGTQSLPQAATATDILKGNGVAVQAGDVATVNFRVCVKDGKELANTIKRGLPFSFVVGEPGACALWTETVKGMAVGGERRIAIAPKTALASIELREIVPPGVALDIRVWLVGVRRPRNASR